MNTKRFGLTLFTGLLMLVSPTFGADLSTPKKAVASFLTALQTADDKSIQAAIYSTDDQKSAVNVMLALLNATTRMQSAAEKKFGTEGEKEFGTSTPAQIQRHMQAVADAAESIEGDEATLVIAPDPETKRGGGTVKLKKIGDSWLINAVDMFKLSSLTDEKARARQIQFTAKMTALTESLTKEINEGKFPTAKDAVKNFWERSKSILDAINKEAAATAPASTAPASQPKM